MNLTRFLQWLGNSSDGKLAEPAPKWLELSFYAAWITLACPFILAPFIKILDLPFVVKLFLPQVIMGTVLTLLAVYIDQHVTPRVKLMLFKPDPFPFLLLIKSTFILLFLTIIISAAVMKLAQMAGVTLPQQPLSLFLMKADIPEIIAIAVSVILVAPILEEWCFRRVIAGKLCTVMSFPAAMILTSLLFSVMHGNLLHAPALFVMGLVLQGIMRRTSSLLCPIIIHAAFNCINVIMILINRFIV